MTSSSFGGSPKDQLGEACPKGPPESDPEAGEREKLARLASQALPYVDESVQAADDALEVTYANIRTLRHGGQKMPVLQ